LDGGRIVQEGRPADIYERPRTRFAASFLGDANFFTGRVVLGGIEGAGGIVRTSDELPAAGMSATVAVRPEKLRIGEATLAEVYENSLQAIVTEIIYAGAVSTFLLEGVDGTPIKILTQNRETSPASPGET